MHRSCREMDQAALLPWGNRPKREYHWCTVIGPFEEAESAAGEIIAGNDDVTACAQEVIVVRCHQRLPHWHGMVAAAGRL